MKEVRVGGAVFGLWRSLESALVLEPVAVAPDGDDAGVMKQAVDEGRGHDLVAEDPGP